MSGVGLLGMKLRRCLQVACCLPVLRFRGGTTSSKTQVMDAFNTV